MDKLEKERGYKYGYHVAPHDIMVHEYTTGTTRQDIAKGMGLVFGRGPRVSDQTQVEKARLFFPLCYFDQEECELGIRALESYKKEWNPKLGVYKNNPLHDWASHGSKAFMLAAMVHPFAGGQGVHEILQSIARDVKEFPAGETAPARGPDPGGWT
jgi:hypothetical protein